MAVALPPPVRLAGRCHVLLRQERLLYFGGCDYLRLAQSPRLRRAVRRALSEDGLSVSASRATTGNHEAYEALESELASFFGVPAAVLLPNGYSSNLAVAETLAGLFATALIDEHAHRSLWSAAARLGCQVMPFRHREVTHVERLVSKIRAPERTILLTDGMFALTGVLAPLRSYARVLPAGAMMLVDDAHGAGLQGKTGRGTAEAEHVAGMRLIQTITLSKAFGAYGGAVLGSRDICAKIAQGSECFRGSTPVPLPLVAAAREALRLLRENGELRSRLWRNVDFFRGALRAAGIVLTGPLNPILACQPRRRSDVAVVRRVLREAGIFPSFIHYGTGAPVGCFRFVISAAHTRRQLETLSQGLGGCRERLEVLPASGHNPGPEQKARQTHGLATRWQRLLRNRV